MGVAFNNPAYELINRLGLVSGWLVFAGDLKVHRRKLID
jgi:hypothetical protein